MPAHKKNYEAAVKLYAAGMSVSAIAPYYGVTRQAIWEALKSRGVVFRAQAQMGSDNEFYLSGRGSLRDRHMLAHRTVERAVKKGLLVRMPCEDCGRDVKTSAHHDDYARPLDVRWLCRKCHHAWHKVNEPKGLQ